MDINQDQKIEILLSLMAERYTSTHLMRERVIKTVMWSVGLLFVFAGWIIQGDVSPGPFQKLYLCIAVIIFVATVLYFLHDTKKGFDRNFQVLVRIEKTLELYKKGSFTNDGSGLYPEQWQQVGRGKFFKSCYIIVCLSALIAIFAIILGGTL
ncbi:MAG: hypothetical protein AB1414_12315 [bacterium]